MAATVECVVAGICGSDDVLQNVSAAAHINYIQSGADVARRTRPDATYSTVRYATQAGAGLKDGTNLENAYGRAELNTALATLSSAHVYLSGTFEPEAYNTAGPIIGPVIGDNVRLDLATYGATVRGYSGLTWTASGVNGEYWATIDDNQPSIRLTEDGNRMRGVSRSDCPCSMDVAAIDAAADTVTVECYREMQVGDSLTFCSSSANGLTKGQLYYVKTATAPSGSPVTQTLTLSTTLGGATLDITGTLSGTKRFWSLVNGRDGDPVPGSLQPGEYSWAPELDRIYMRPSWGTPDDHVYTCWQLGSSAHGVVVNDAAGVVLNPQIIGGDWYGFPGDAIVIGDTVLQGTVTFPVVKGAIVHAAASGILAMGATDASYMYNEVYGCSDHAIGSKNGDNNEARMQLHYNYVHDHADQPWDANDGQALATNPLSDDTWIHGNVVDRVGSQRNFIDHPLGLNSTINIAGVVCDSNKRQWITGNYFGEIYGETSENGPNDVQSITQLVIKGNVFDRRNCLPALQDYAIGVEQAASIRVSVTNAASAGIGFDYTNIVDGNLFLLGTGRDMTVSVDSAALAAVRNVKTGGTVSAQLKLRNNVVLCLDPDWAWDIYALRYSSAATGLVTGIDSDYNTYYSANTSARGVAIFDDTSGTNPPVTTVALATLGNGTGWTSPDGTVSDKHSTVWDINDLNANFATNSTVLKCLKII